MKNQTRESPRRQQRPAQSQRESRAVDRRREMFVLEYLKDLNATQAAIRAGYSRHTAKQQGHRLLTDADLTRRIEVALAERKVQAIVDSERLEREAERIAVSDFRRVFRDGRLMRPEEIPDDVAPAIASFEVVTKKVGRGKVDYVTKVRFWDKNVAQKTLFQLRGDGKVNEKGINVRGDLTVRQVENEHAAAMKLMTADEFERSVELSSRILALHDELKAIAAAAVERSGGATLSTLTPRASTGAASFR